MNHGLTRRDFLLASMGVGAGLLVLRPGGEAVAAPPDLDVLTQRYPVTLSFRQPEYDARGGGFSYEDFERRHLPFDGIIGKVLNEENYYAGKNNLPFFRQFKQQNPRKMVLLHYNGTGRRATDEATTRFFPGHFLHYKGTKLTKPISNRAQTVLHVADTSVFDIKRYRTSVGEDIAITRVGSNGRRVWGTTEQVRLVRINAREKTITVRRGMYGTTKNTYPTGSYLAAHVTTGPYRYVDTPEQNIPLWAYNFSTLCPRDGQGRNCAIALADYLKRRLGPGGNISSFDGITLDVLNFRLSSGAPIQDIDANADGRADQGVFEGKNTVGVGVNQFLKALRERLPNKVLLSDGHVTAHSQRGFGILNGAESEGYPDKADVPLDHLSRGENIFGYWKEHSTSPSLNYANFRYKDNNPGRWRNTFIEPNLTEDRTYRKLRLALASALFTDTVFGYGGEQWTPPEVEWREPPGGVTPGNVRVLDEMWKGREQVPHWLGQPMPGERGKPVHRAALADDIFDGDGSGEAGSWQTPFIGRFRGERVDFRRVGTDFPILEIRTTSSAGPRQMSFVLGGIPVPGADLFVSLRLRAGPLEGFSASVPRGVNVSAVSPGGTVTPEDKEFTWAGRDAFEASLYFQDVGPGTVELRFEVEGKQKVYFERLTAHSATDGRHREYEGGIVFANPSPRAYTFNVGTIFKDLLTSGVTLRRLQGTATQHPEYEEAPVNDGSVVAEPPPVGEEPPLHPLTLPAKDALFLVKEQP